MAKEIGPRFAGGARLTEARKARSMSVSQLSQRSNVAERSIRQYESGQVDPCSTTLERIAAALDVRMEWLVAGKEPMRIDARRAWQDIGIVVRQRDAEGRQAKIDAVAAEQLAEQPEEFYVLPLLNGTAACGPGHVVHEEDIEGPAVIHRSWCPHPERTDYVRCRGHSMEPTVPDEAIVTIDRAETDPEQLLGYVVAVWVATEDAVTIKRLAKNKQGDYVAMPDHRSPDVLPFELAPEDRIIGKVRTVHAELAKA